MSDTPAAAPMRFSVILNAPDKALFLRLKQHLEREAGKPLANADIVRRALNDAATACKVEMA